MPGIPRPCSNILACALRASNRNGSLEPIDLNKILKAISWEAEGIPGVDPGRVAIKTIGGLYYGASTQELDRLSIQTASSLIGPTKTYNWPLCAQWGRTERP